MAKKSVDSFGLSSEIKVDVYRFRGIEREFVSTMTISEWRNLAKDKGWNYRAYQIGFVG